MKSCCFLYSLYVYVCFPEKERKKHENPVLMLVVVWSLAGFSLSPLPLFRAGMQSWGRQEGQRVQASARCLCKVLPQAPPGLGCTAAVLCPAHCLAEGPFRRKRNVFSQESHIGWLSGKHPR